MREARKPRMKKRKEKEEDKVGIKERKKIREVELCTSYNGKRDV